MKIHVGNLHVQASEDGLRMLFERHGQVERIALPADEQGYAVVDMPDPEEAQSAIDALQGQPYEGRPLDVNPARPGQAKATRRPEFSRGEPEEQPPDDNPRGQRGGGRRGQRSHRGEV